MATVIYDTDADRSDTSLTFVVDTPGAVSVGSITCALSSSGSACTGETITPTGLSIVVSGLTEATGYTFDVVVLDGGGTAIAESPITATGCTSKNFWFCLFRLI